MDITTIFLLAMIPVFYLFFIRPQMNKQKQQDNFLNELERGKEIVTSSGIVGKITKIEDSIITIQSEQKTFIRITRGAVSKELTESLFGKTDG